jgi:hypothetical protein
VTVTDANGCTLTGAPQTITEPTALSLTQSRVNNSCFQGDTGSISITTSGGTAPYRYSWTGPNGFTSTSRNLSNLAAGTYTFTITKHLQNILGAKKFYNENLNLGLYLAVPSDQPVSGARVAIDHSKTKLLITYTKLN